MCISYATWHLEIIKKKIDKRKNGENVPSLKVFQVVLVQSNLVDNQYL